MYKIQKQKNTNTLFEKESMELGMSHLLRKDLTLIRGKL